MTIEQAKSELMQIYGMLSPDKQRAIDTLVNIEPCEDAISRQAVDALVDELARAISDERCCISRGRSTATIMQDILDLPPVNPQVPKYCDRNICIKNEYNGIGCDECEVRE